MYLSPEGTKEMIKRGSPPTNGKDYLWTSDINVELPIFVNKTGMGSQPPSTLTELFINSCMRFKDKPALLEYNKLTKQWSAMNFAGYLETARNISRSMIVLGVPERSCVGILSYNSAQWNCSYYGAVLSNCVPAGLYMTNTPITCQQVLSDCKAAIVFVEDQNQLDKIIQIRHQLPYLRYIVTYENVPLKGQADSMIMSFEKFLSLGIERNSSMVEIELESRIQNAKPGQCCTLVYTSGTTGVGKGVMLSHDNLSSLAPYFDILDLPPDGRVVSYLPCSHIASLSLDIIATLCNGSAVYFADKEALKGTLADYIKMVRPTIFLGVPRIYEKIKKKIEKKVEESSFLKKKLFGFALSTGDNEFRTKLEGKDVSWKYKLAKKLVFDKIMKEIGFDETQIFVSGAAPLKKNIQQFFHALGAYIFNAYGLSETTGCITIMMPKEIHEYRFNSVGRALEGTEVIIGDGGEILFRSRTCFMGYLNREADTIKAIDNKKRVHSGDIGEFDSGDRLFIKGRIKELIVTAGGENVAPYPIENRVMKKLKGFASWAIVIGDERKYLSLLVTIRNANDLLQKPSNEIEAEACEELKKLGIEASTMDQLFEKENFNKISKVIQAAIDEANKNAVSNAAKIRKWIILSRDLSVATEELTPTLKLKRKRVEQHFNKEIDGIYTKASL